MRGRAKAFITSATCAAAVGLRTYIQRMTRGLVPLRAELLVPGPYGGWPSSVSKVGRHPARLACGE